MGSVSMEASAEKELHSFVTALLASMDPAVSMVSIISLYLRTMFHEHFPKTFMIEIGLGVLFCSKITGNIKFSFSFIIAPNISN